MLALLLLIVLMLITWAVAIWATLEEPRDDDTMLDREPAREPDNWRDAA